ncbi:MAG: 30S ribosomal protein S12 methylthiotransferase RimO, partial [Anaerolineae bacterium]
MQHRYNLLSLGCSKNTVDSESIAQLLHRGGYQGVQSPEEASVLIVNTCGFIDAAKQESINALQDLADSKRKDQLLIAAGCLAQRYGQTLTQ